MRKRLLIALFAGAAVFGAAFAFAAALDLNSDNLAAGDEVVVSCDTDGVTATYDVAYVAGTGYTVSSVDVTGIDAACDGQSVGVTLTDGGAVLASATGTADATGSLSVAIAGAPSAELVDGVHAVIHGPVPAP
jgi:hypothetical protein